MMTVKMILIALSLSSGSGIAQHMVQSLNTTVQRNGEWIVTYRNAGTIKGKPCRGDAPHVFTADEGLSAPAIVHKGAL